MSFTVLACVFDMDGKADANQIVFYSPSENWRRAAARPCCTSLKNITDALTSFDMELHCTKRCSSQLNFLEAVGFT